MERARVSVAISTADFKAVLIPGPGLPRRRAAPRSIVAVLGELAERGVEVRVLHAGIPSGPVLRELRRGIAAGLAIRRCPRVHGKAVVIDCERLYLGSANLTGAGLGAKSPTRRNFELGVWVEGSTLIDPVLDWFNAIWEGKHCNRCGRRELCPVPLEEPPSAKRLRV